MSEERSEKLARELVDRFNLKAEGRADGTFICYFREVREIKSVAESSGKISEAETDLRQQLTKVFSRISPDSLCRLIELKQQNPDTETTRDKQVNTRFTAHEIALIDGAAELENQKASEFVVQEVLGKAIRVLG